MSALGQPFLDPCFRASVLTHVLEKVYCLEGKATELVCERDLIAKVVSSTGEAYVLRICEAGDNLSSLALPMAMMEHIHEHDQEVPVPRIKPSPAGRTVENVTYRGLALEAGAVSFLEGCPVAVSPRSVFQRQEIGAVLARLDQTLSGFEWQRPVRANAWNMSSAARLKFDTKSIVDHQTRRDVVASLTEFETIALPALQMLRAQYIHNDFNPHNILVACGNRDRVTGIIDFGDVVRAPRAVDLAVAIARQIGNQSPLADACDILSAYHASARLEPDEVALLYDLICTRLCMRITIWSRRLGSNEARIDASDIAATAQLLSKFRNFGRSTVTEVFLAALNAKVLANPSVT